MRCGSFAGRALRLAVFAGAAGLGLASLSARADVKDFTVRNTGSAPIEQIYVSPNYSSSWDSNVLGAKTISPGGQSAVRMRDIKEHCIFDIRIEDSEGYVKELYDEDLCQPRIFDFP